MSAEIENSLEQIKAALPHVDAMKRDEILTLLDDLASDDPIALVIAQEFRDLLDVDNND